MTRFGYTQTAAITLLCLLWGGNLIAMKVGFRGVSPVCSAGVRFALGAIGILVWAWSRGISIKIQRMHLSRLLFASALFTLVFSLFTMGLNYTTVQRGAIFLYTQPIFVALIAHFAFAEDRLNTRKIMGLLIAFSGVVVVFLHGLAGNVSLFLLGDILILGSSTVWAYQTVYIKKLVEEIDPLLVCFYTFILSFPQLIIISWSLGEKMIFSISPGVLLALTYQGLIVASFSFVVWNEMLKRYKASNLSSFLFLTPIFGVLLGGLFWGEGFALRIIVGLILVVFGVQIVNAKGEMKIISD